MKLRGHATVAFCWERVGGGEEESRRRRRRKRREDIGVGMVRVS